MPLPKWPSPPKPPRIRATLTRFSMLPKTRRVDPTASMVSMNSAMLGTLCLIATTLGISASRTISGRLMWCPLSCGKL